MKSIIVVKTCDGDVYFGNTRVVDRAAAVNMAVSQVIQNDLSGYEQEDRESVMIALASGKHKLLWEALENCGAISVEQVRTGG